MHTITEIKKNVFIDKSTYEYLLKYKNTCGCATTILKKTRGINVFGVMKNSKCYHVVLDKEYLEYIKNKYKDSIPGANRYNPLDLYIGSVLIDIFPDKYMMVYTNLMRHPISNIRNAWGYNRRYMDDNLYTDKFDSSTFEFDCWDMEEWIQCPLTKEEQRRIDTENQRKSIEKLNTECLKDTIIATLKQKGLEIEPFRHNDRICFRAVNRKVWNNLVLTAINNYINQITNEQGFEVIAPKTKSNAKITDTSPLFYIDEVKIKGE